MSEGQREEETRRPPGSNKRRLSFADVEGSLRELGELLQSSNSAPSSHQPSLQDLLQEGTSFPTVQSPAASDPDESTEASSLSPRRLRSGKVLTAPNSKVGLDKFLNSVYERAREAGNLNISHCEAINTAVNKSREQRLAQILKFKQETENFRKELLEFQSLSRSLNLENKESTSGNNKSPLSESECLGGASETSAGEVILQWLNVSLVETELEDETDPQCLELKPDIIPEMADEYIKVAKLTSQLVPLFTGAQSPTLSTELQTFLGCCRRVLQCLTEPEKAAFLQIFPTRLRGEAYQLIASNQPATFEDAEKLLNRTYLPRETYQELVNKLIMIRQYPLESLTSYVSRIKQQLSLCKEAATAKYAAAAPAMGTQLDDFAKNALKGGVNNPHLCQYLLTIGDETLDTLIQKALDMERLQQTTLNIQSPYQTAQITQYPYQTAQIPLVPHNVTQVPQMPTQIAQVPQTLQYNQGLEAKPNFFQVGHLPTPNIGTISDPSTGLQTGAPVFSNVSQFSGTQQTPASQPPAELTPPPTTAPQQKTCPTKPSQVTNSPLISKITCSFCQRRGHTYSDCLKRKNTPFCTICRTYNHDARDCRRTQDRNRPSGGGLGRYNDNRPPNNDPGRYPSNKPPNPQNSQTGNRVVFNIRLRCDFCGRRGHKADDCRQRQRWETSKQGNSPMSGQNSPTRQ